MSLSFRQSDILKIAKQDGRVMVEELAETFNVTVQTIRRDLSELADMGKLDRVHGGAVLRSGVSNIGYEDRRALNADTKTRIAQACAQDIPDGASLFMNIGTSTEAVARQLLNHKDLMVVTNNMNVANILVENTDCEIVVAGGVLRRSDGGLVGNLTISTIEQFKFDYAVIGCSALDAEGDLLDFDFQEVRVSQTIIAQARQTLLVADHSKFQRTAPARIASLAEVDVFYTDLPVTDDLQHKCVEWQTRLNIGQ
ncbi:Glycerol-3-phosphate regulon repressor [Ruegeria sp. THAF57]|uniref:DeoR/GlpR family DNA-binding transcription regulator n=1 Tax=Ruegeria sp. THAF57 TaxID=2744555 RepID=UPI0015DE27AE|nr:DeoR/GlpR family DNA-binding transcription regulator [Ruegeria sp. THAF57]CAD0183243.1 Glycerol-3-phosphate regulon repressor [Ruegeria sp. THAF57]